MITIIDYECGNLRSVQQAVEACGAEVTVSSDVKDILAADQLILPGVGAFPVGMTNLRRLGLDQLIQERVQIGTPLLGICLGMQLLFESSTEHGGDTGLGLIPGQVVQIDVPDRQVKLPNVGWVPLHVEKADALLQEDDYFYFVHSFHAQPQDPSVVLATAEYEGLRFCAAVSKGRVWGMQFHPENSAQPGLSVLKRFVELGCLS
jgi:glutamine amidotransferase